MNAARPDERKTGPLKSIDWLNYHHLMYFWVVAREGTVAKATVLLHLAQPTISAQIRSLERTFGFKLFDKQGRHLVLTERGQAVFRYAEEIFSLGQDLQQALQAGAGPAARFRVGVSDVLHHLTTYCLLEPALQLDPKYQLLLRIDKTERLLADLAIHLFDVVLTDTPAAHRGHIRMFNHLLGECDVTVFGTPALVRRHGRGFPQSLQGAPMVLQTPNTALRQSLEQWFVASGVEPAVEAEIEDVALLQTFGRHGLGLFVAPSVVAQQICEQYHVEELGTLPEVRQRFYAVSIDRRRCHPAVLAISTGAQERLFVP